MKHGGKHYGADATDGKTVLEVWKYAKNNHMIPQNDPIPKSALIQYVIDRGIIKGEKVVNGGRLPERI